ncbi:MAG TPA: DUF5924 family protein, partial [Candidatus Binatia bacterium]|nr:DUF5924 family protein [Candidatus Binatia bacterium]
PGRGDLPPERGALARWGATAARLRAAPAVQWLLRWGISVASLVGGLLALFVFRRELPHVRWIVGYLILVWLLFALWAHGRRAVGPSSRKAARLVVSGVDYTLQTLYHGILLFLIPAYWASTTLDSPNVVFFALVVLLALLATFDPWYRALVAPRPWLGGVFFLVSVFGALNVALPLVGVPPHPALVLSAWAAVLALTPALVRAGGWPWRRAVAVTGAAAVAALLLAHLGRAWIPPAPLSLAGATLAWDTASVDALEPVPSAIHASDLHRRGLVALTAVYAPAGLEQQIQHVWRREGEVVDVVRLTPVRGGRREGFRTLSRKTAWPADAVGRWTVDVMTNSGQLIGRLRFRVVP